MDLKRRNDPNLHQPQHKVLSNFFSSVWPGETERTNERKRKRKKRKKKAKRERERESSSLFSPSNHESCLTLTFFFLFAWRDYFGQWPSSKISFSSFSFSFFLSSLRASFTLVYGPRFKPIASSILDYLLTLPGGLEGKLEYKCTTLVSKANMLLYS